MPSCPNPSHTHWLTQFCAHKPPCTNICVLAETSILAPGGRVWGRFLLGHPPPGLWTTTWTLESEGANSLSSASYPKSLGSLKPKILEVLLVTWRK